VFRRDYNTPNRRRQSVGQSPIIRGRFSLVDSEWKFELQGFATVEEASFPEGDLTVTLDRETNVPAGMVRVGLTTPSQPQEVPISLL
jgi:hypothetical protein